MLDKIIYIGGWTLIAIIVIGIILMMVRRTIFLFKEGKQIVKNPTIDYSGVRTRVIRYIIESGAGYLVSYHKDMMSPLMCSDYIKAHRFINSSDADEAIDTLNKLGIRAKKVILYINKQVYDN